jgi:UDP-glucuronate 4-epimerase
MVTVSVRLPEPILVTGGAGFIGSHLVDFLLKERYKTVVMDDFNDFYDPRIKRANIAGHLKNRNYSLVEGDICEGDLVEGLFKKHPFGMVVHLAARAGVRPSLKDPLLYERVNGIGTLNLLESCRRHKVERFIIASSSSVYGINSKVPFSEGDPIEKPISPYAATKRANELTCFTYHHLYGMRITCLRFFTVYGPRQRPEMAIHKFTRLIHSGAEVPVFGDGTARRDFTFIDDILQGVVRSMEKSYPYEIFNLGESHTIDLRGLIGLIEKALGRKANLKFLPAEPGDVPVTYADIAKSRKMLEYDPGVPIEQGVPEFVDWYQKTQGGTA